ncbi:MAG: squalene/phytoene synthase family protein [Chloracidobacterium sp.]|nr:squalene/phytoene synthase family protein [Chloracidobacterium sp.]
MLLDSRQEDTKLIDQGLQECKAITRKYGTSFYFATQFFPRETRDGIYAVYAFARIPDEIVDDPGKGSKEETLANSPNGGRVGWPRWRSAAVLMR